MMNYHFPRSLPCHFLYFFLVFFLIIHSSYAETTGRKLVDEVCKQTSNYQFCIESIYSDARAADADAYTLADIVFRLAYGKATTTKTLITLVQNKASSHSPDFARLQTCASNYDKGVAQLEEALNDLNSETFDGLAFDSGVAAKGAVNCEAAFNGTKSPLTTINKDMEGLCEICIVVSKEFTGGVFV